jgi:hypothetical protein
MSKQERAIRGRLYIQWIRAYIECLKFDRPVSMLGVDEKVNRSLQMELWS